jgi:tetratricopeptide (TPR) repeat protein
MADAETFAAADPGIAVLPFSVYGEGLELWREGMLDLLATDMNGVGGLRAIDSRTLLARWREKVPDTGEPDRATALQVAQATGARYALLGSALAIGPTLRLSADIYDTDGGVRMGTVQVEGSPDSVLALVDGLAVQALLVVLEREATALPPVDLASVTTTSIPALTAWLEAEALHRRGDIPAAILAYERAVAIDSTFALAFHGLSLAYGWFEGGDRIVSASELALRWVDRLPPREAALVQGTNAWLQGDLMEADEILQRLVRIHPDYAMAWYALGELYYHTGKVIPVSVEDAHQCYERAAELDPRFAPFRLHLIDIAFQFEADSAQMANRIAEYKRLTSANAVHTRLVEVAFDLGFADQAQRQRALASLDTLDPIMLQGLPGNPPLTDPRFLPQFEAVLLARERRGVLPRNTAILLFRSAAMGRGHLKKALEHLDRPQATAYELGCFPVDAFMQGFPVPPARLEEAAAVLSQIDSASEAALVYCAGFLAAAQGRWADHTKAVELAWDIWRQRANAGRRRTRYAEADALAVEAYGLWRRGEPETAVARLAKVRRYQATRRVRAVLGHLLIQLERWEEAVPYLEPSWTGGPDHHMRYHLARAHEAMGDYGKAAKEYAYFVEAWEDADPELQPWVEDARQAIARPSLDR